MDILEERYHKAPIIVTSQVEPQGWIKLFEDPVIAEAIVDRLIHPSQKITLKGEKSYREKLAEKKTAFEKPRRLGVKVKIASSLRSADFHWSPSLKSGGSLNNVACYDNVGT
jgi:hypothetical protein